MTNGICHTKNSFEVEVIGCEGVFILYSLFYIVYFVYFMIFGIFVPSIF